MAQFSYLGDQSRSFPWRGILKGLVGHHRPSEGGCQGVDEEKMNNLNVANRKNAKFEDFMEIFMEAATRIAHGIDIDTFLEDVVPLSSE